MYRHFVGQSVLVFSFNAMEMTVGSYAALLV